MNILLLASHSVAEYDDLRMLSDLGYDVFAPGGYSDPAHPATDMRPALPNVKAHPELDALCVAQREKHAGEPDDYAIDWAKADLHSDLVDWADTIIVHHFPERWIGGQWRNIRRKRVIWRTCGQSNPGLERYMAPLVKLGLQVVRYSPRERIAFEKLGAFAGEDTLIRFGKYPADWYGWTGSAPFVGNVTQDMIGRGAHCGIDFWREATEGLPVRPAGRGSEELGGVGLLPYEDMREYLRNVGVYLYTGTQPASYTLGLIEAMMTGTPVVSIGPERMWLPTLFEGGDIVGTSFDDPAEARTEMATILADRDLAAALSAVQRERAIVLFGIEYIGPQWANYLGGAPEVSRRSAMAVPA